MLDKRKKKGSNDFIRQTVQLQEKFHLSEEKVMKLLKHANKGGQLQDHLLLDDFDPNQVSFTTTVLIQGES